MTYFNFHAQIKKLILSGKLKTFYIVDVYKDISPALILVFDDPKRPIVPIRKHMWDEYFEILDEMQKEY